MADSRLYTIRDVARELGLPESTVRYYRNAFAAFLPSVGTGRRRRYPAEAVPLLRLVAEGYAQNRPRAEIEQALCDSAGSPGAGGKPVTAVAMRGFGSDLQRDELLATILDGERERREVMWQMARELVRLGEAIERQQVLLTRLAGHAPLPAAPEAAGPAPAAPPPPAAPAMPAAAATPAAPAPELELDQLRQELARERELVERLRRSKLDVERRAAEAEARLGEGGAEPVRRGLFGKLLAREEQPRR